MDNNSRVFLSLVKIPLLLLMAYVMVSRFTVQNIATVITKGSLIALLILTVIISVLTLIQDNLYKFKLQNNFLNYTNKSRS